MQVPRLAVFTDLLWYSRFFLTTVNLNSSLEDSVVNTVRIRECPSRYPWVRASVYTILSSLTETIVRLSRCVLSTGRSCSHFLAIPINFESWLLPRVRLFSLLLTLPIWICLSRSALQPDQLIYQATLQTVQTHQERRLITACQLTGSNGTDSCISPSRT